MMQISRNVRYYMGALVCAASGLSYADIPLNNDVAVTDIAAATGQLNNYIIEVPETDGPLTFSMAGGTGDADLYVRAGAEPTRQAFDCRPFLEGNNETCTYDAPSPGTYHVMVRAYSDYNGVSLIASFPEPNGPNPTPVPTVPGNEVISLTKGETLSNQTGTTAQETHYVLAVPDGAVNVQVATAGGSGDADLYVRFGAMPTVDNWDCRPFAGGNSETCNFPQGQEGNYYVMLRAYAAYSGVNISANYSTDGGGGGGGGNCELTAIEQEFLTAHNNARSQGRSCGGEFFPAAPPLSWSCQLADAALRHSNDMAFTLNDLDHTGSDNSSAGDRIRDEGYQWSTWSENIAAGQTSVSSVMSSWLNSPNHCRGIMSSSRTQLGGALVVNNSARYSHWWTAVFARPQ